MLRTILFVFLAFALGALATLIIFGIVTGDAEKQIQDAGNGHLDWFELIATAIGGFLSSTITIVINIGGSPPNRWGNDDRPDFWSGDRF